VKDYLAAIAERHQGPDQAAAVVHPVKRKRSHAQIAATRRMISATKRRAAAKKGGAPKNPIAVKPSYARRKKLQSDLTRYEKECLTSSTARKLKGGAKRKKSYCAAVAWKRARMAGRHPDYFEENPMAKNQKKKTGKKPRSAAQKAATAKMLSANANKKGATKKQKAAAKRAKKAAPKAATKRAAPKKTAKKKAAAKTTAKKTGGRKSVHVPQHDVHIHNKIVPISGYKRHQTKMDVKRGPYNYQRAAAMENPLTMPEGIVLGVTGVLGFITGSLVDRMIATHALKEQTKDEKGVITAYSDAPELNKPYNMTAVLQPMGLARWGAGLGMTAVPIVIARLIKSPMGRTTLQGFGVGVGLRTLGKAADDAMAYLFRKTSFGLRFFEPEIMAKQIADEVKTAKVALPPQTIPVPKDAEKTGTAGLPRGLGAASSCSRCGVAGCACNQQQELPPAPPVEREPFRSVERERAPMNPPPAEAPPSGGAPTRAYAPALEAPPMLRGVPSRFDWNDRAA
jgi:hypothetical protein